MANATTPVIQVNEGKVGIGIANPTTSLHLIGIAQIVTGTDIAFYEGASVRMFGAQNYSFRSSGGNTRAIIDVNASGVSAGNLSLYNANTILTSYINNAGNSYFNGGNVGIGTTNPAHTLDVQGPNTDNAIIARFYSAEGARGDFVIRNGSGVSPTTYIGTGGGGEELSIGTEDTNVIYIDDTQRVGIGTTDPDSTFHVKGISTFEEVTAGGGTQLKIIGQDSSGQFNFLIGKQFNVNNAFEITPSTVANGGVYSNPAFLVHSNGNVGIGTTDSGIRLNVFDNGQSNGTANKTGKFVNITSGATSSSIYIGASSGTDWLIGKNIYGASGQTFFQIGNQAGSTPAITISAGSDYNVGIGTTSPDAKLEVAGGSTGIILSNIGDSSAYDSIEMKYGGFNSGFPQMSFRPRTTPGSGIGNTFFKFINSNGTSTTANNRANITVDNQAGIGPTGIFTANHILNLSGTGIAIKNDTNGSSNNWSQIKNTAAASGSNLVFLTATGTNIMDDTGNFGIGVTSPGAKLDVVQTIADWTVGVKNYTANGYGLRIDMSGGSGVNAALQAYTATGTGLIVKNNGLVGIGTFTPDKSLVVKTTSAAGLAKVYSDGNGAVYSSNGDVQIFTNNAVYPINFYSANKGGVNMVIKDSGKVGIGITTNTTIPLHVNQGSVSGTVIKASGIGAIIEIQASSAGNATLYQRPNVTGDKEAEFRMTLGSTYGWSWIDDNSKVNSRIKYMKLQQSNGTLTVKGDIVAFGAPSDRRYKDNIKPIESALDKAMKLEGVTFDWKESDSILDIKEDIGFIAQDVQKVVPELVRENKDGKLSLRYQGITPILLEAIKELKAEIEELKKKIK